MFNLKVWLVEGLRLLEWVLREGDSRIVGIEVDERALREELEGGRLHMGEAAVASLSMIKLLKVKGHHLVSLLQVWGLPAEI